MGYGYHSGGAWYVILIPAAFILVRMFAGQRRRRIGGGRQSPAPPAMSNSAVPGSAAAAPHAAYAPGPRGIPAGWLVDPSGRFDQRYWSGTEWTDHVTKDGVPSSDPPPGAPANGQ
jgi:hypothetical protein